MMSINWIGLYTIVRREVQRMARVPIQVFIGPWISALLFIFIFGFVLGGTMRTIGGHRYIEFVMPGVLMMNIINAAFLQSSSAIYFARFVKFIEEMLVAPLSYLEMVLGSISTVVLRASITGVGILLIGMAFGATTIQSWPLFIFWIVAVLDRGSFLGLWSGRHPGRPVVQEFRAAQHAGGVSPDAAFHAGRKFLHHEDVAGLAALVALGQSLLLFHQRHSWRHDRRRRSAAGTEHRPYVAADCRSGRHGLAALCARIWPERMTNGLSQR
jgi:hypothetical protein